MIQKFSKIISDAKYAVDGFVDEHQTKKEQKRTEIYERRILADLSDKSGTIGSKYHDQRRRFIGRFFLVGIVDIASENDEYNKVISEVELHRNHDNESDYNDAMDYADSLYDEIVAVTQSRMDIATDKILKYQDETTTDFISFIAASKDSYKINEHAFGKTNVALKEQLNEKSVRAGIGTAVLRQMTFNDNHMHTIMSDIEHLRALDPNKSPYSAIAIVDPSEPMNPYMPTKYHRGLAKELMDGGVVQLRANDQYYVPPIWTPID